MKLQIGEVIKILVYDIETKLSDGFIRRYYKKMSYSDKNKIITLDKSLLKKTISFEIAFIHVVILIFNKILTYNENYGKLLKKLDDNNLFSWYKPSEKIIKEYLNNIDVKEYLDIYSLINQHDKLIHKDIKKILGQFYTPANIAQRMISEVKSNLKAVTNEDKLVDPACGTGVFLVEAIKILNDKFTLNNLIEFIDNNVYAFDVNPFAVVATKINILYKLYLDSIDQKEKIIYFIENNELLFQNIKWKNTIVEDDSNNYTVILGNPPYFKLNKDLIKNIKGYKEILYGQPNIYSFFMYWGIKHLKKSGVMCFIVPQSIRSGLYFKNLRAKIYNLRIRSMIHIDSRQNIFDRAEQAVLIICLENKPVANTKTKIQFYNVNGAINTEFKIARSKLMMDENHDNIFVINKRIEMYNILDKVYSNSSQLSDKKMNLKFSNGLFVWNQHKNDIINSHKNTIPIIYGGNVQSLNFDFEQSPKNSEKKKFAKVTEKTERYVLRGKRLLVQRTTNFEKDIRLKACIISDEFLEKHERYFVENHVNFLSDITSRSKILPEDIMYYYLGILNSKLINYIFISKSGNTQVSANELNSLPFPKCNIDSIAKFVKDHQKDLKFHQKQLDLLVCNAYGLSESEINFIINF